MSLLVGWHHGGRVAVYNEETDETVFHSILYETAYSYSYPYHDFGAVVRHLCNIVVPNQIKRLVYIHDKSDLVQYYQCLQTIRACGFTKVNLLFSPLNSLQALLLNESIVLNEDECCAVCFYNPSFRREYLCIFRVQKEQMVFVENADRSDHQSYDHIWSLVEKYDIKLAVNCCQNLAGQFRQKFPDAKVISADTLTNDDFVRAALWTAKKMEDGTIPGIVVNNIMNISLSITSEKQTHLQHNAVFQNVPFSWQSSWAIYKKNTEFQIAIINTTEKLKMPTNTVCRVCLDIDSNGQHYFYFEQKPPIAVYLQNDYFSVGWSDNNKSVETCGPYPCVLKFDSDDKPMLVKVKKDSNILKDAIRMLDPTIPACDNWLLLHAKEEHVEYAKVIIFNDDNAKHVVSAPFAVNRLLQLAIAEVKSYNVIKEQPVHIVVPSSFTDGQRNGLLRAAKLTGMTVFVANELLALANGFAIEENMTDKQCILIVNMKVDGCAFFFAEVTTIGVKEVEHTYLESLRSEEIREAAQIYDVERKSLQLTKDDVVLKKRKITELRDAIKDVLRDRQSDVKAVLLTGSCHLVPAIQELLYWTFLSVEIATIEDERFRQLVLLGATEMQAVNDQ